MKVSAVEFARLVDRSKAWVSLQISEGMPAEGAGRPGAEMTIDTGEAIAWMVQRARDRAELQHRRRSSAAQPSAQKLTRAIFGLTADQDGRLRALQDLVADSLAPSAQADGLAARVQAEIRATRAHLRRAANTLIDKFDQ